MAKKSNAFNKSSLLTAVAAAAILVPERVHIPELDGDLFVKRMTVGEREDYFVAMKPVRDGGKMGNVEAFMYAVANEDGTLMFDINNEEDFNAVRSLPNMVIERVIGTFNEINFKPDTVEAQEDDIKNS